MYLIQRSSINKNNDNPVRLMDMLKHDYMGSAEFEFGALPKSIREIHSQLDKFEIHQMKVWGADDEKSLRIFCRKDDYGKICDVISKITSGMNHRTKESTYLEPHYRKNSNYEKYYSNIDMWWCIDSIIDGTPCFFSWNKKAIMNLRQCIIGSVKYMDEQKQLQK